MRHGYFELFDWLEQTKAIQPTAFFERMRSTYGITDLVYVDVFAHARRVNLHRLCHTLSPAQGEALRASADLYLPSLKFVLASVKPVEHSTLRLQVPTAGPLFERLAALGGATEGVSYPLLSRVGRGAALSIGLPLPAADLALFLRCYGRDIQTLTALFHAKIIDTEGPAGPARPMAEITPREREVLRWSAAGKSYWEIAVILGITERTVRFFMSNARQKLDVVSNTQAVAEAVWRGLIPHL